MKVKMEWNKTVKGRISELSSKGQELLDSEVLKSSNVFIPMDSVELLRSSLRSTNFGSGRVIWDTVYARRLYYNPDFNFSKDKNTNAQGLWYEAAKSKDLTSWISMISKLKDRLI